MSRRLQEPTKRTQDELARHALFVVSLDAILLCLPLLVPSGLLLSVWGLAQILGHLLVATSSALVFNVLLVFLIAAQHFFFPDLKELLSQWYGAWTHLVHRIFSVLVAGSIERWRLTPLASQALYSLLVAACLFLSMWATGVLLDDTQPGQAVKNVLLGKTMDIQPFSDALLGALYLSIAALGIGLSASMMVRDRWIGLSKRLKHASWQPENVVSTERCDQQRWNVAHLSDLHAQAEGVPMTESDHCHPSGHLERLFQRVQETSPDVVVVSGDLSDDGSLDAWNSLLETSSLDGLLDRLVLAPGNHDLNLVERGAKRSFFRMWSLRAIGAHLRAQRYLRVANLLMGERALLMCPFTGRLSTLADVMVRAEPDLHKWNMKSFPLRRASLNPLQLLDACFPMLISVPHKPGQANARMSFMAWNSVKRNRAPLFNAMGDISPAQLERADTLLSSIPANDALIHVMHHQLALPRREELIYAKASSELGRITELGMVLENPTPFIRWLAKRTQQTVLLHGHHHKYFVLTEEESMATIVSAPSATVGCEESYRPELQHSHPSWLQLDVMATGPHAQLVAVTPQR